MSSSFSRGPELPNRYVWYDVKCPSFTIGSGTVVSGQFFAVPGTTKSYSCPSPTTYLSGYDTWDVSYQDVVAAVVVIPNVYEFDIDTQLSYDGVYFSGYSPGSMGFIHTAQNIDTRYLQYAENETGNGRSISIPFQDDKLHIRVHIGDIRDPNIGGAPVVTTLTSGDITISNLRFTCRLQLPRP